MENSVEIPLKTGNRTATRPSNPSAGYIPWGNHNWKRHMYLIVHCSTVTIARTWKQPRCLSADEWIRELWYIYTMEYYSATKMNAFESVLMRWMNLEPIIHSEVSQKKTNPVYWHIHMEFWKMIQMILHTRLQRRCRSKEETFEICGRRWGWDDLREQHWNMYINRWPVQVWCIKQGTQSWCSGTI